MLKAARLKIDLTSRLGAREGRGTLERLLAGAVYSLKNMSVIQLAQVIAVFWPRWLIVSWCVGGGLQVSISRLLRIRLLALFWVRCEAFQLRQAVCHIVSDNGLKKKKNLKKI